MGNFVVKITSSPRGTPRMWIEKTVPQATVAMEIASIPNGEVLGFSFVPEQSTHCRRVYRLTEDLGSDSSTEDANPTSEEEVASIHELIGIQEAIPGSPEARAHSTARYAANALVELVTEPGSTRT